VFAEQSIFADDSVIDKKQNGEYQPKNFQKSTICFSP